METEKYNGYTNYETWAVALWIDNEQAINEFVKTEENNRGTLSEKADFLKEYVENWVWLDEATLRADLLGAALGEVNWFELSEIYTDDERGLK